MKDIIKRILVVLIFWTLFIIAMILINNFSYKEPESNYKYLTKDGEWGNSTKCYKQDKEFLVCIVDGKLIGVKQYYEE